MTRTGNLHLLARAFGALPVPLAIFLAGACNALLSLGAFALFAWIAE